MSKNIFILQRIAKITIGVLLFSLSCFSHANLIGLSLNNIGGTLNEGLGELDPIGLPGVGFIRSTIGDCHFDSINTTCILEGNYLETPDSTFNPLASGAFRFITMWAGDGPSPLIARSVAPGSDDVVGVLLGDLQFNLEVSTMGQWVTASEIRTEFLFTIGFNQLGIGGTCSGLGMNQDCRIGEVASTPGSSIRTLTDENSLFYFSVSDEIVLAQIPAPGSAALLFIGLLSLVRLKN